MSDERSRPEEPEAVAGEPQSDLQEALPAILLPLLRKDEGLRLSPYQDTEGYWTIGYGHLIDRRRGGELPRWVEAGFPITLQEAEEMLTEDAQKKSAELVPWSTLNSISALRKAILISMAFQLGTRGLLRFRRMFAALRVPDWPTVSKEMRDSWWWQNPDTRGRAERLARAMETDDPTFLDLPA